MTDDAFLLDRRNDRRRQSDQSSTPWWLRTAKEFGAPTVMLAGLIWFLTQIVGGNVEKIRDEQVRVALELSTTKNDHAALMATFKNHEAKAEQQLDTIAQILRQMCVQAASSPLERAGCLRPFQER